MPARKSKKKKQNHSNHHWITITLILLLLLTTAALGRMLMRTNELSSTVFEQMREVEGLEEELEVVKQEAEAEKPPKSEYKIVKISDEYWEVIDQREFYYQGKKGIIGHACIPGVVRDKMQPIEPHCFGENLLLLEMGNELKVLDSIDVTSEETTVLLNTLAFNRANTTNIEKTNQLKDNLLVNFGHNQCFRRDSLCIPEFGTVYQIAFPEQTVRTLKDIPPYFFDFDQFNWNPSGTKAVMMTGCPEGCPTEKLYGYDLIADESFLLYATDETIWPFENPIEEFTWESDDEYSDGETVFNIEEKKNPT